MESGIAYPSRCWLPAPTALNEMVKSSTPVFWLEVALPGENTSAGRGDRRPKTGVER